MDGGSTGYGTLFKVNTDGTGFEVLYNFNGTSDDEGPMGGLTMSGNTLYGTTDISEYSASVFSLTADGSSSRPRVPASVWPPGLVSGGGSGVVGLATHSPVLGDAAFSLRSKPVSPSPKRLLATAPITHVYGWDSQILQKIFLRG
jgi:uncharacterized repeat protein (TIGR03803 family)